MRHGRRILILVLALAFSSCQERPVEPPAKPGSRAEPERKIETKPSETKTESPPAAVETKKVEPPKEMPGPVRRPAVAGQFYPSDPAELAKAVDSYLDNVSQEETRGRIIALVAPHAGYVYSAQVAAFSYSQIKGKKFDTVVLIGLGHRGSRGMVSLYPAGCYETPLGKVPVNGELAAKIMMDNQDLIKYHEWVDAPEHCLEVQLPFLQRVLKDFRIVPILITDCSLAECEKVAKAVADACRGENVLLVASSDLSHYPAYPDAVRVDKAVMQSWVSLDPAKILATDKALMDEGINNLACAACGRDAVITTIMAAKRLGANAVRLLKYANSGDVSGERSRVVGYGAAVVYQKAPAPLPPPVEKKPPPKSEAPPPQPAGQEKKPQKSEAPAPPPPPGTLSPELRRKLLVLARSVVESAVKQEPLSAVKFDDAALQEHRGAFVTIKNQGRLRGCIGNFVAREPLFRVVQRMAMAAATQDARFFGNQITVEELKDVDIEISVLSPLVPVADPMKIELGKHGIYIINEKKGAAGCFLPQVASETGWSAAEFLSHCARDKAGLPADAWKNDPDTTVLVFTAEVFGEKE